MSEQHAFTLTVTRVFQGSFDEAFNDALGYADEILNADDGAHVVVTETGQSTLGTSTGVYCEGCDGHVIPGVRWPTAANDDHTRDWVERCDTCQRYESDEAAAQAVVDFYAGTGTHKVIEHDAPLGSPYEYPFVEERPS